MKTIADFKRAMRPGTRWLATHQYIGNNPTPEKTLGPRECVLNNTVGFGFKNPDSGETSHCDWPKKIEFSTENNVVIITKPGFCRLTYTQVEDGEIWSMV